MINSFSSLKVTFFWISLDSLFYFGNGHGYWVSLFIEVEKKTQKNPNPKERTKLNTDVVEVTETATIMACEDSRGNNMTWAQQPTVQHLDNWSVLLMWPESHQQLLTRTASLPHSCWLLSVQRVDPDSLKATDWDIVVRYFIRYVSVTHIRLHSRELLAQGPYSLVTSRLSPLLHNPPLSPPISFPSLFRSSPASSAFSSRSQRGSAMLGLSAISWCQVYTTQP